MRADIEGLDASLKRMENAAEKYGERFEPPAILRRLVGQGRLGQKSGQGFFPWPQPDEGWGEGPVQPLAYGRQMTRGTTAIVWINNPPANSISPTVVAELRKVWDHVKTSGVRAVVIASGNPLVFSAGADIKAFTTLDERSGAELIQGAHALFREMEQSGVATIAAVNAIAYGGGCELAMATDVLRRHPAPAAPRRRLQGTGDEPDRRCDHRRGGLRVRAGRRGRARPRAAGHRAALGAQAR